MASFIGSLSPRLLLRLRLGLRAFEWLPFPWRFSRLDPEAAEDFLRKLDSSRFPLHHDLLLMGKLFSTLGYAVAPEVEARIGTVTELRARRRHRCPSRPARWARPSRTARARNATS